MRDADEAVGQSSWGAVGGVAGGEGPQVARVGQAPAAGVAGEQDPVSAEAW